MSAWFPIVQWEGRVYRVSQTLYITILLVQLSYLSEDFPDTDFVLQLPDRDLSWRYKNLVLSDKHMRHYLMDSWCLRNTQQSRGQKSPTHHPRLLIGHWVTPRLLIGWLRSPLEMCGITELVEAVTRNYNGDQFCRGPGKWGREDLWTWYKLSSADAWSNYQ